MPERSIYEQLTGVKVADTTIEQLDFTKNSFIDTKSIEYWKGVITISKILDASRTYPHGLPIPATSAVETLAVANASVGTIKPTGTEIWLVQAIDSNVDVTIGLFDGTTSVFISSGTTVNPTSPLYLTTNLYLAISNGSGSEATIGLAYHKVSL